MDDPHDTQEVLELFRIIEGIAASAVGFSGVIVRSVGMRYATESNFFAGTGAAKAGGRWNRVGIAAVYASLDLITATTEAYQAFLHYGFPLAGLRPRATAGARVVLSKVVDVTDPATRRKLGFSLKQLTDEDWRSIQRDGDESWTQAIGRGALLCGVEAILVPSARHPGGKNIVNFPANLAPTSAIQVLGSDDLLA